MNNRLYQILAFLLASLAYSLDAIDLPSPKELAQQTKQKAKSVVKTVSSEAKKVSKVVSSEASKLFDKAEAKWNEIDPPTKAKMLAKAGLKKTGEAISDAYTYVSEYGDRKEAERQRQDAQNIDALATYLATNPEYAGKEIAQRLFLTEFSLTEEQTMAILLLAKQKYEVSKKI